MMYHSDDLIPSVAIESELVTICQSVSLHMRYSYSSEKLRNRAEVQFALSPPCQP